MTLALVGWNAALVLGLMTVLWVFSVYRRDASIVDPWWSMAFLLVTAHTIEAELIGRRLQRWGAQTATVADASGTTTTLADNVTYARLGSVGAVGTSAYGILFELYPDLSTPEGHKAEGVAAESVPKPA